jgi:hypothetical protein
LNLTRSNSFESVDEALPTAGLESTPSVILTSSQAQVPPPPQTPPELAAPVPLEQHEEEKGEHRCLSGLLKALFLASSLDALSYI